MVFGGKGRGEINLERCKFQNALKDEEVVPVTLLWLEGQPAQPSGRKTHTHALMKLHPAALFRGYSTNEEPPPHGNP